MRISDWSSDVCSSDLFDRGRLVLDALGGDRHGETFAQTDDRDDDRAGVGAAAHRGDEAAVDLDPVEGQRPKMRQRTVAGAEIVRSEEHTSELQSLMRISYAVFCLKKKKYKQIK